MRDFWTEIARREQTAGRLAPHADTDAVGTVLFTMTPGYMFGHLLLGDISPETMERGLRDLRGVVGGSARGFVGGFVGWPAGSGD